MSQEKYLVNHNSQLTYEVWDVRLVFIDGVGVNEVDQLLQSVQLKIVKLDSLSSAWKLKQNILKFIKFIN